MSVLSDLKSRRLYFDGGMGTMLQERGLRPGELPEIWNITHPKEIEEIHFEYLSAGCDILTCNTFGANSLKFVSDGNAETGDGSISCGDSGDSGSDCGCPLYTLENIIKAALSNAAAARERYRTFESERNEEARESEKGEKSGKSEKDGKNEKTPRGKYLALDIGPLGRLLAPLGDLKFEKAVEIFGETVRLGEKYGADLILIETMNDSYETKAAYLAARENSSLPIFVTNAYDESGKLMTGASPAAMTALLEGLGADAIGINCSLGPDKMMPVIKEILENSSTPVIVSPNAGLPVIRNGRTAYDLTPEKYAEYMSEIAKMGACVMGGCCGTTPAHIRTLVDKTKDIPYALPRKKSLTVVSSFANAVRFDKKPVLIGERINPTGRKALKEALRCGDIDYILREGLAQQDEGADILDVNVGLPDIDESAALCRSVSELQAVSALPLSIDTSDTCAMEKAMRIYNGKPLINSVNGKKESMDAVFPIAAKYGGVIIALTISEEGIPETAQGRVEIAEKIIAEAKKYGIGKNDIIVDPLAMTVSANSDAAAVTLETIKRLTEMGIKTSLGVSNVSFGLPERNTITSVFFTMAMQNGLSAAIMNPKSKEMKDAYFSFCALAAIDFKCLSYIEYASNMKSEGSVQAAQTAKEGGVPPKETLLNAVLKGLCEIASASAKELVETTKPLEIIDDCIIPALDKIGADFEEKRAFLPQLLMSAEAAKAAFDVIKERLLKIGGERKKKMKVAVATVKGDIHDIGKNIVKTLLENYDFEVIDLGKDVAPEDVLTAAKTEGVRLVGLSALMTTTVPAMEETIRLLKKELPDCRTVVGGAVLTQEYADMIGADKYAKDAMETVRFAESLVN